MPHPVSPPRTPADHSSPKLFVNDGPLEPSMVGQLKPSSPDEPLDVLRQRYNEDGYIYLKRLSPKASVSQAREAYFTHLSPSGVSKPGTQPVQGIFDCAKDCAAFPGIGAGAVGGNQRPGGDAGAIFVDRALEAHTMDWYAETFCKHPALVDFVREFSGWGASTSPIKRTSSRNNVPGTKAIGVHYDQIFLRHGEPTSITAWVPIGDVSVNGGGLIYSENGHTLGREQEERFTAAAMADGSTEEEAKNAFNRNMMDTGSSDDGPARYAKRFGRRWSVADYEAGDVVSHTPFTIHASTTNHDPNHVIRLATDLRFVDSSKPWDKRWDKHYEIDDGV